MAGASVGFQARVCWPNKRAGRWTSMSFIAADYWLCENGGIFKETEHRL